MDNTRTRMHDASSPVRLSNAYRTVYACIRRREEEGDEEDFLNEI